MKERATWGLQPSPCPHRLPWQLSPGGCSPLSRNCTQAGRCSSFLIPLVFFPILMSRLDQPSPRAEMDTLTMHPPGQPSAQCYYSMAGKGLSSSENSVIISFRPPVSQPLPRPAFSWMALSSQIPALSAEVFSALGRVFKQLQQRLAGTKSTCLW